MLMLIGLIIGCENGLCERDDGSIYAHSTNLDLSGDAPVFSWTEVSGAEDSMTYLSVLEISEGVDTLNSSTPCRIDEQDGYGGLTMWAIEFPEDIALEDIPKEITYGIAPDGTTEDTAPNDLQDGSWYELSWSGCSMESWFWKHGDPSSAFKVASCYQ